MRGRPRVIWRRSVFQKWHRLCAQDNTIVHVRASKFPGNKHKVHNCTFFIHLFALLHIFIVTLAFFFERIEFLFQISKSFSKIGKSVSFARRVINFRELFAILGSCYFRILRCDVAKRSYRKYFHPPPPPFPFYCSLHPSPHPHPVAEFSQLRDSLVLINWGLNLSTFKNDLFLRNYLPHGWDNLIHSEYILERTNLFFNLLRPLLALH